MATGELQTQSWIPPLPPGWEARWAPAEKTYFYIDHSTKKTTWEDPRFIKPTQPEAAQALSYGGGSQHNMPQRTSDNIPMKDMRQVHTGGHSHINQDTTFVKTAHGHKHHTSENGPAERLKAMFPLATTALVQDILTMCNHNEREAMEQLADLGFERRVSADVSSRTRGSTSSPHHQPVTNNTHLEPHTTKHRRSSSPHHISNGSSPHRTSNKPAEPTKRELSGFEKTKVVSQMLVEFHSLHKQVVNIAVESCDYDVDRIRNVLKGLVEDESTSRPTSSMTHVSNSSSIQPSVTHSPATLEPVVFANDVSQPPSQSSKVDETTSTRSVVHPPSNTTSPAQQSPARHSASPTRQQQQKAKHVTKHKKPSLGTITSQPLHQQMQVTTPSLRKLANGPNPSLRNGPNPSLRNGPDSSLLLGSSSLAKGPNPEYRSGPDPSRRQGPQGARGPDPSLCCGAQSGLRRGPSLDHLAPKTCLVTNI